MKIQRNPHFTVSAFAPATVANVSCGFDVFGLAAEAPGDAVHLRWSASGTGRSVNILRISGDGGILPTDGERNTAGVAILRLMSQYGIDRAVDLELEKGLPLGSGMGSSAASSVAALVAFNKLAGLELTTRQLLPFALESERMACGSAHADNVAPCLLGGFVLIRSYEPLDVISIPFPSGLRIVLVHPDIELQTRDSRKVLRASLSLPDAVRQWGNTAGVVAGLMSGDMELLSRAMVDYVVEPVRSLLIPGYDRVRSAAMSAGAIGAGISGSGPSLFAICLPQEHDHELPIRIGQAMQQAFTSAGLTSHYYVSGLSSTGAAVIHD